MAETRIDLDDGKYTVIHENGTNFRALRYGERWRELTGDKLVFSMACEIENLRARLDEIHSWIVCTPIARPADMMGNASRIEKLSNTKEPFDG